MFKIIPTLEIMKSVTDKNITGDAAEMRERCFDEISNLQTISHIEIIIEGMTFDRIKGRLNSDHVKFFETAYRIDDSATGVEGYNVVKSIIWVAIKEAADSKVLIITENVNNYDIENKNIKAITPSDFMTVMEEPFLKHFRTRISTKPTNEIDRYYLTQELLRIFFPN